MGLEAELGGILLHYPLGAGVVAVGAGVDLPVMMTSLLVPSRCLVTSSRMVLKSRMARIGSSSFRP